MRVQATSQGYRKAAGSRASFMPYFQVWLCHTHLLKIDLSLGRLGRLTLWQSWTTAWPKTIISASSTSPHQPSKRGVITLRLYICNNLQDADNAFSVKCLALQLDNFQHCGDPAFNILTQPTADQGLACDRPEAGALLGVVCPPPLSFFFF